MPDVPLWTDCNQACAFCSNPEGDYRDQAEAHSFAALTERLERHGSGEDGVFAKFDSVRDYITLTGGEPTMHPRFLELLGHIRRRFPDRELRLLSNARRLADAAFADALLKTAGAPFEAGLLLCGPDAATHERIAGAAAGAFDQTVRGIENLLRLKGPGQRVEIRLVLSAMLLPVLRATLLFIRDKFPTADRVTLLFIELEGRALWRLDDLRVGMSECGHALDALYGVLTTLASLRLYHLPLCALPPRLWPFAWRTLDPRKVVFKLVCRDCPMRPHCVGVHKAYARHTGAADLGPIEAPEGLVITGDEYRPIAVAPRGPARPLLRETGTPR